MAEYIISTRSNMQIVYQDGKFDITLDAETVEEIVRCKDCIYYDDEIRRYNLLPTCELWHYGNEERLEPKQNGFCAWGERKQDNA